MTALEELVAAYRAAQDDAGFHEQLSHYLRTYVGQAHAPLLRREPVAQARRRAHLPEARGPGAHRRAQDQQRARTGAARRANGQAAHHRRDGRRAARGRHRHGLRHAGTGVPGVHGRGGHAQAGHQRVPDATAGRGGARRDVGQPHAQGRNQRGHSRLGDQRAHHLLPARKRRGPASVPDDGARLPVGHRRGGAAAGDRGGGPAAGLRRGLRGRRQQLDRPVPPDDRRRVGAARGRGGRRRGHGVAAARCDARGGHGRACCTAPCRTCCRTSTGR